MSDVSEQMQRQEIQYRDERQSFTMIYVFILFGRLASLTQTTPVFHALIERVGCSEQWVKRARTTGPIRNVLFGLCSTPRLILLRHRDHVCGRDEQPIQWTASCGQLCLV